MVGRRRAGVTMADMSYGKMLARKAPPPDAMDALGGDDDNDTEPDEDGDDAAAASAFDDFAKAAGFKPSPAAYSALKELIRYCMK